MNDIAPTSHIDPKAELGERLKIGPGASVGAGVVLRDGCEIGPNASVLGPAVIGEGCRIFPNAVVGGEAQVVGLGPDSGGLEIGAETIVREGATVHRSMYPGRHTVVGARCYIMVAAHVGHDARLGERVTLVNHCSLGGHVEVGEGALISNVIGVHQHVRVGAGTLLVGPSAIRKDVPPFVKAVGEPPCVAGLNVVGLRRSGVSAEARAGIKSAYKILLGAEGTMAEKIERVEAEVPLGDEIRSVLDFVRHSERGIYQGRV